MGNQNWERSFIMEVMKIKAFVEEQRTELSAKELVLLNCGVGEDS